MLISGRGTKSPKHGQNGDGEQQVWLVRGEHSNDGDRQTTHLYNKPAKTRSQETEPASVDNVYHDECNEELLSVRAFTKHENNYRLLGKSHSCNRRIVYIRTYPLGQRSRVRRRDNSHCQNQGTGNATRKPHSMPCAEPNGSGLSQGKRQRQGPTAQVENGPWPDAQRLACTSHRVHAARAGWWMCRKTGFLGWF